jgi:hypothetical protein
MEPLVDRAFQWGPVAIWLVIFLLMYTHVVRV